MKNIYEKVNIDHKNKFKKKEFDEVIWFWTKKSVKFIKIKNQKKLKKRDLDIFYYYFGMKKIN